MQPFTNYPSLDAYVSGVKIRMCSQNSVELDYNIIKVPEHFVSINKCCSN